MSAGIHLPGESALYRERRDELLSAEVELRDKLEQVAQLRRQLPAGGIAQNYVFQQTSGNVTFAQLFGRHDTLIVYSFMFGGSQQAPCPMCSAFIDSVSGQIKHIQQRAGFVVVARSEPEPLARLVAANGWDDITWVSAAHNTYPLDYHSEMADGTQVPMCSVFTRDKDEIRHFWTSEMFFSPAETQPRHIDLLWPLWNFFDLTPEGRGNFMPGLNYAPFA